MYTLCRVCARQFVVIKFLFTKTPMARRLANIFMNTVYLYLQTGVSFTFIFLWYICPPFAIHHYRQTSNIRHILVAGNLPITQM